MNFRVYRDLSCEEHINIPLFEYEKLKLVSLGSGEDHLSFGHRIDSQFEIRVTKGMFEYQLRRLMEKNPLARPASDTSWERIMIPARELLAEGLQRHNEKIDVGDRIVNGIVVDIKNHVTTFGSLVNLYDILIGETVETNVVLHPWCYLYDSGEWQQFRDWQWERPWKV